MNASGLAPAVGSWQRNAIIEHPNCFYYLNGAELTKVEGRSGKSVALPDRFIGWDRERRARHVPDLLLPLTSFKVG